VKLNFESRLHGRKTGAATPSAIFNASLPEQQLGLTVDQSPSGYGGASPSRGTIYDGIS
jgi:hypothetical protein